MAAIKKVYSGGSEFQQIIAKAINEFYYEYPNAPLSIYVTDTEIASYISTKFSNIELLLEVEKRPYVLISSKIYEKAMYKIEFISELLKQIDVDGKKEGKKKADIIKFIVNGKVEKSFQFFPERDNYLAFIAPSFISAMFGLTLPRDKHYLQNLRLTEISLKTATPYVRHKEMSSEFKKYGIELSNINLVDMTAGVGGDALPFASECKTVTAIELNDLNFRVLKNNIDIFGYKNITAINDDSRKHLHLDAEVYYLDPLWTNIQDELPSLGDMPLITLIKHISKNKKVKFVILKLSPETNISTIKVGFAKVNSFIIRNKEKPKFIVVMVIL